jgi:ketosteroid isomerase-like protein
MEKQTAEVIRRFNEAFQQHNAGAFADLVAENCVLENTGPAPNGSRHVGREAALAVWTALASNPEITFDLEEVFVAADRAIIRWRLRRGDGDDNSVRGVNLMRVRDGQIVEGMGYIKS